MSRKKKARDQAPFEIEVTGFDDQGRAVARRDGKVVFIHGALPGEQVQARYLRMQGRYDEAEVQTVLKAHPSRVTPKCEHHDVCGGCVLQHLDHSEQIKLKQERLAENLKRLGHQEPDEWLPPLVGEPWGYRTKARLGVKNVPKKGGALVGFRERQGRYIADINACPVLDSRVGKQIGRLRETIGGLRLKDRIPQIEVSLGETSGTLAFRHLDDLQAEDRATLCALGEDLSLTMFGQGGGPATIAPMVSGESDVARYRLDDYDLTMRFGLHDFTQVNFAMNQRMVRQAIEWLRPQELSSVLDLFCGIGNFTLPIARSGVEVMGVEGSEPAVQRARENAAANGLGHVRFEVANLFDTDACSRVLGQSPDGLLLDPPRSGAAELVAALKDPLPKRIVYVSCSPSTLARDTDHLCNALGYRLRAAGIIDMFPHTNHVESMAVFER